jgi:hypothetical protein
VSFIRGCGPNFYAPFFENKGKIRKAMILWAKQFKKKQVATTT